MQPRRRIRLVAGALILALPLLTSCGFGKATDKVYTPGAGTNNRAGDVKVLAAVVAAAQPDSGTFIASFSNNGDEDAELTEVVGAGEWTDLTVSEIDPPVELAPGGFVNLAIEGGIPITGDFEAGDVMELTFNFASGETVTMDVPVVYACDVYEGLDISVEGASPESDESESPEAEPTDDTTPSESAEASPAPSSGELYDCVPQG